MKPYLIKTPSFIKLLLKNWVWSFSKKEKVIYLTFDDGPTPEITEWTLNQLNKHNAKATFFCIGKNVVEHPDIYSKIIENGHSIGNHTHNHFNSLKTSLNNYIANIELAENSFTHKNQQSSKLFRPPYGKLKLALAKKIRSKGYKIIMWDVLSADFDVSISKEDCLQNVISNAGNGSIIVFHDSIKASSNLKFVLPQVLEYYAKIGFVFKRIDY